MYIPPLSLSHPPPLNHFLAHLQPHQTLQPPPPLTSSTSFCRHPSTVTFTASHASEMAGFTLETPVGRAFVTSNTWLIRHRACLKMPTILHPSDYISTMNSSPLATPRRMQLSRSRQKFQRTRPPARRATILFPATLPRAHSTGS
jgi:hypothetical protein